jgi:hypothetical protein
LLATVGWKFPASENADASVNAMITQSSSF